MTYQRPAYEEVTIAHGGNTVALRPSLRAALTLVEQHGFPTLFRAVDDFNVTIVSEIILATATSRQDAAAFLSGHWARPLLPFMLAVRQPLVELVSMFIPAPDPKTKRAAGKPVAWPTYYRELYRIATGWLGWTPEAAWNATPTEITEAAAGKYAMLRAIHGGAEDDQPAYDPREEIAPEEVREGINKLKSIARGQRRA
ncbi:hypothetical protein REJC140_02401 [Pseudorhizobium endolithicum]|uniref:Tail assembly chaperone n=1 Tax=Pseudorhizobium endolithicum TaxID=1191678 RepID=A0ABM8PFA2_9HYPH|nr:hypothetical protein [Pseudorhizobium endolithicum]CAD7026579.1 hypothetical protein REJC140_02401 [Pseudorhizobium endolithicum]